MYSVYTLCTMHLTRCTSLDVLHSDLLHSMYYALHSVYYAPVYYALDTLHFNRCIYAVYLILCVLDPMYFSEGLCTEEPFAMLSGRKDFCTSSWKRDTSCRASSFSLCHGSCTVLKAVSECYLLCQTGLCQTLCLSHRKVQTQAQRESCSIRLSTCLMWYC